MLKQVKMVVHSSDRSLVQEVLCFVDFYPEHLLVDLRLPQQGSHRLNLSLAFVMPFFLLSSSFIPFVLRFESVNSLLLFLIQDSLAYSFSSTDKVVPILISLTPSVAAALLQIGMHQDILHHCISCTMPLVVHRFVHIFHCRRKRRYSISILRKSLSCHPNLISTKRVPS